MKKSKKILAALLAGVMVLGTGLVAFAENGSPSVGAPSVTENTGKTSIAAGKGTIAAITNAETMKLVDEQENVIDEYVSAHCTDANGQASAAYAFVHFDVQGVSGGEVSVKVEDISEFIDLITEQGLKPVAMVFHYNETTKKWEGPVWSEIKMDGDDAFVTFKFDSYSPIIIAITDAAAVDGQTISPMAYSANPVQTVAASPKTGDATAAWLVLFGVAVVAVAVSRKKLFA